jgi:hypothetical protein
MLSNSSPVSKIRANTFVSIALVAAHVHHLEDRGAAPGGRGEEAGAERMAGKELRVKSDATGARLDHPDHGVTIGRNSAPVVMLEASSHARTTFTGQATEPQAIAMVSPAPSWLVFDRRM